MPAGVSPGLAGLDLAALNLGSRLCRRLLRRTGATDPRHRFYMALKIPPRRDRPRHQGPASGTASGPCRPDGRKPEPLADRALDRHQGGRGSLGESGAVTLPYLTVTAGALADAVLSLYPEAAHRVPWREARQEAEAGARQIGWARSPQTAVFSSSLCCSPLRLDFPRQRRRSRALHIRSCARRSDRPVTNGSSSSPLCHNPRALQIAPRSNAMLAAALVILDAMDPNAIGSHLLDHRGRDRISSPLQGVKTRLPGYASPEQNETLSI